MIICRIINKPVPSNCYVIHESNSRECLIIDPGSNDNSLIMAYLNKHDLFPSKVILTHEHFDHIWGITELTKHFNFDLICNQHCANAIIDSKKNLSLFYDQIGFAVLKTPCTIDTMNNHFFWRGDKISFFETPGHSDGSISVFLKDILFCGDLMIQCHTTITKLPTGSVEKLKNSIEYIFTNLSPQTLVYSGHGESFILKNYMNK